MELVYQDEGLLWPWLWLWLGLWLAVAVLICALKKEIAVHLRFE